MIKVWKVVTMAIGIGVEALMLLSLVDDMCCRCDKGRWVKMDAEDKNSSGR